MIHNAKQKDVHISHLVSIRLLMVNAWVMCAPLSQLLLTIGLLQLKTVPII